MNKELKINFHENEQAEKKLILKIQTLRFKDNYSFKEISLKMNVAKSKIVRYCTDLKYKQ